MKRWQGALAVVLVACLSILLLHAGGEVPRADRDTWTILSAIRERGNPLSWFATEWPLQNGFYRPVTVLSFELDLIVFPASTYGYGLSAAIYCAFAVLALFWFAREVTDSPGFSAAAALLFALWHTPVTIRWDLIAWSIALVILVAGIVRHKSSIGRYLHSTLAVAFVATELYGVHRHEDVSGFYFAVLHWIPSRTATVMTICALAALASYARYVRLTASRKLRAPTALDVPATRSATQVVEQSKGGFLWLGLSGLCLLLALGSYEQAVVLPILLLLIAWMFRLRGFAIRWSEHALFWIALFAYFGLRRALIPAPITEYIDQQLRSGVTVVLSALNYIFPTAAYAPAWYSSLPIGSAVMMLGLFYSFPIQVATNIAAYVAALRDKTIAVVWLCSVFAFLPMAFLKPFSHYHYWAMSLRSLFVVMLVGAVWKLVVIAVSPPAVQAPQRLTPSPGSLPHP